MQNYTYIEENYTQGVNGHMLEGIFPENIVEETKEEYENSSHPTNIMENLRNSSANNSPGSGTISIAHEAIHAITSNNLEATNSQLQEVSNVVAEGLVTTLSQLDQTSVSVNQPFANQHSGPVI